ncbi:MAG TPA: succinate dehydrogenase, hydrophobic membrane anchor protein [Rhizomicrobium sp.]|nr:succinate dehydrogenase, hydrophobic membrane anchor protein [Rhizomicrobium sp.]
MSIRTPFSRVQGLGSAHSGTEHFWRERASSVALIPLSVWFCFAAVHLVGLPYQDAFTFLHEPINAIAMLLFVIASVVHMTLGLQVVIEDYVHTEGNKLLLFLANKAFGWIIGVACTFAILRIAL